MGSRRKDRKASRKPPPADRRPAADSSPRRVVLIRAALIVLAGAITYANALSGPFVLDDQDTIVLNEQIRQLSPSVVLFPAVELPVAGRPIVNLSFALNYAFAGFDVRGYHLVNVVVHIACGLLLFGIVRRTFSRGMLGDRFGARSTDLAFAASLIWLVHPLQTDAVDYVTQRTELVMGLFYLLTLYASIRAVRLSASARAARFGETSPKPGEGGKPDTTYYREETRWCVLAVAACALGMASKESMVTAPLMVLVYDRVFVFRSLKEAWQHRRAFYLALAATWVVLGALVSSGPRFRSAGFSSGVSVWTYLLNQALMIVRYLRLAIWPDALVVDYGAPRVLSVADVWPYGTLILALIAATVAALKFKPALGFLGAWFFVTLSPTSSIVPIATEVGAERRMYLPLAAVVVLAVAGASWVFERWKDSRRAHMTGLVALATLVVVLASATMARNREYASAVSLARSSVERWPTDRARHSLGAALVAEKRYEEGIEQLRQALAGDAGAYYTLGVALYQQGKLDEAVNNLREFLEHESMRLEVPTAHELIGRALKAQGRCPEAADEFRRVLGMTPSNSDVHGLLAECLWRQENFEEAIGHYRQFLARRPNDLPALMQLGIAYAAIGWRDEAIAQFRRVVEINPRDGGAHANLAQVLLDKGAYAEALPYARQAVSLRPDNPVAHHQLGLALAAQKKFDDAVIELRRALELNPKDAEVGAHLELVLQQRAKESAARTP